jgi:hypothetical protein
VRISTLIKFLYNFLRLSRKNRKNTLPAVKRHPPRRGIVEFIPPLRGGTKGGVPFSFFVYSFFTNIGVFRIEGEAELSDQL